MRIFKKYLALDFRLLAVASLLPILFLTGCFDEAQTLTEEPSAADLDDIAPSCPGISTLALSAGPALAISWGQASDNITQSSSISYKVFMRKNAESYDLVSPSKIVIGATSTLISSGVSTGNTYTLFVTCNDQKGNVSPSGPANEQSITVDDSLAPSQITNLAVGSNTFTSLLLTWSPSDDGVGGTTAGNMRYKVYVSSTGTVSTAGTPLATVLNGGTSYTHSGLTPATTYYYRVVALDASNNLSADSNEASGTTLTDTTAPTFAGNTSATLVTGTFSNSLALNWSAATDNVTSAANLSYRIYRCDGSTTCDPFSTLITTVTGGVVTYTDLGLASSTVYVYGIRAVDSSGNVSTNTDKKITSTLYNSSGTRYAYPTIEEVNIRMGQAVAVANVVGTGTGVGAFPDLLVGAPNASEAGTSYRFTGCVFVFEGTGTGAFSATATQTFCQPSAVASGTQNGLNFGSAIAVGNLDGDDFADIVVSSPLLGRVYIYRTLNSSNTLSINSTGIPVNHPSLNTTFGTGICIGNSDNVGADDLFVITTSENCDTACSDITGTGNVLVFNNTSTSGFFVAPSSVNYRISPSDSLQGAGYSLTNNEVVARSCTLGNFDPGNLSEIQLVIGSGTVSYGAGAGNDGVVSFYRKTSANTFAFANALPTSTPSVTGNRWGSSVSRIQLDAGGTTVHELVVGAPLDSNVGTQAGAAYIYTVGTGASGFTLTETADAYFGGSDFDNNNAGISVAAASIWNTDGREDLIVGAHLDDGTSTVGASALNTGQVFTYRNTSGIVNSTIQQGSFDAGVHRVKSDYLYGFSLCKGDVNNDDLEDLIVGSPNSDYDENSLTNNNNVGALYIYYGVESGEMDLDNPSQIINAPGAQSAGAFGHSCVVLDYNKDGQNDLLVGSPFRDVVQTDRGAVYIYYGADESPIPSTNSAVLNGPAAIADGRFGFSLAKGDLDNNGFDDLIVGAVGINTGATRSGRVYVFWATDTTGLFSSANYTQINPPSGAQGSGGNTHLANTQTVNLDLQFGRAVGTFRTVNSSTGLDLIVCTFLYDPGADYIATSTPARTDMGNCWIYEGKVNGGLSGSYQVMTSPRNEIRYPTGYSNPENFIYFGAGLTKGDWNSDGVEDLIICASRQRNLVTSETNAGGCFAYYGQATGGFNQYGGYLPNFSGARPVPQPDDVYYNPNAEPTTASRFGEAVLMMDINNNYNSSTFTGLDLIIGEPLSDNTSGPTDLGADSGRVFVIRGGY